MVKLAIRNILVVTNVNLITFAVSIFHYLEHRPATYACYSRHQITHTREGRVAITLTASIRHLVFEIKAFGAKGTRVLPANTRRPFERYGMDLFG